MGSEMCIRDRGDHSGPFWKKSGKTGPNPTRPSWIPKYFGPLFGHSRPNQPLQQLRLAIPCRGSWSKLDFGPREAQSGPKPYFWDGLVSAPRRICRSCERFQALRPIFRRCEGFSGAAKDFQALRRIFRRCGKFAGATKDFRRFEATHVLRGWRSFFFSGKMHVLEKSDMPPWHVGSILDRF